MEREEKLEYFRKYRKNNAEKLKKYKREHYLKNKERYIISTKKSQERNKKQLKEYKKKTYINSITTYAKRITNY